MTQKIWFGARTVYDATPKEDKEVKTYEERVVVLLATDFDEAIEKAECEANTYAAESDMEYLGYVNVFQIFNDNIDDKTEVYSLMWDSILDASKYIDTFFDTGSEKTLRED